MCFQEYALIKTDTIIIISDKMHKTPEDSPHSSVFAKRRIVTLILLTHFNTIAHLKEPS